MKNWNHTKASDKLYMYHDKVGDNNNIYVFQEPG